MANVYYNLGKTGQLDGTFSWGTTVMKCALMSSNYTPVASQSLYSMISGSESTGTGYTTGGATLAGVSLISQGQSEWYVDAQDVSWTSTSVTTAWGIIYASVSGRLVGAYDFGGSHTVRNGTFGISWNSSDGLLKTSSGVAGVTAYTLTGSTSGTVGSPVTYTVTLGSGSASGSYVITPADAGGGAISPSTVTLSAGTPSNTFTVTRASATTANVSTTNDRGLSNPTPISLTSVTAGSATGYTLTGPATVPIGATSVAYTIAPTGEWVLDDTTKIWSNPGTFSGTIRVTRSDTGGHTDYTWSSSATPQTFTVIYSGSAGSTFTLTPSCTVGGLPDAPALTVTGQTLVTIDSTWLASGANGGPNGPFQLTANNTYYRLATDVTVNGSGFQLTAISSTLDGAGHTISYDNAAPITITNPSFETGDFTGWDVSGAAGASIQSAMTGMYGSYMGQLTGVSTTQTVISSAISVTSGVPYRAGIIFKPPSDYNDLVTLYVVDASNPTSVLASMGPYETSSINALNCTFTPSISSIKLKFDVTASTGTTTVAFDYAWCRRTGIVGIDCNPDGASNRLVKLYNLTLTQGQAKSCSVGTTNQSPAINATSVTLQMQGVTVNAGSADTNIVHQNYSNGFIVRGCTFNAQMDVDTNRQAAQSIYYALNAIGVIEFEGNTLTGSHQNGLGLTGRSSTADITAGSKVWNNLIAQDATWTDCYCIGLGAFSGNLDIAYNSLLPTSGRGIIIDEGNIGQEIANLEIHHNHVRAQERGNLEYGQLGLIATALRIRNYSATYSNINIYNNNFWAYTGIGTGIPLHADAAASGFRISGNNLAHQIDNASLSIHDNHFKAIVVASDPAYSPNPAQAWAASFAEVDPGINLVLTGNTFESNVTALNMGDSDGTDEYDMTFTGSTFINNTTEGESRTFASIAAGNFGAITSRITVLDSVYEGGAPTTPTFLSTATKDLHYGWTLNLTVTHLGSPVSGAAVTVTDAASVVQFSGTTDANGQCLAIPLVSDLYAGTTSMVHTSYNPFSVHATSGALAGTQPVTMSSPAQSFSLAIT